jgi:tetratricopeptide (TPR) repeat protein
MTDLLYLKLKQKSKATRALETHATMQGCSEIICTRLIQFYAHDKDSRGIENMLTKLYQKTKNPAYAQKLMELYASKKEYDKAIRFLKQSKFDDLLLLDIYTSKKDFQNALTLAETLYEQNGNPALLARSAILEYENAPDKNSKPLLKKVSKKFDTVVEELKDPLYYNYYGYVLIEHELDIDRGIELVKKALKKDPDSAFYIDSLAWGLYKKGDCQQAYDIIKPIAKNHDEKEIVDHINIIQRCAKEAK